MRETQKQIMSKKPKQATILIEEMLHKTGVEQNINTAPKAPQKAKSLTPEKSYLITIKQILLFRSIFNIKPIHICPFQNTTTFNDGFCGVQ